MYNYVKRLLDIIFSLVCIILFLPLMIIVLLITYINIGRPLIDIRIPIFNILKGEMSFVGPRAFICGEKLPKGEISPKRYLVKPGVVGLAQSMGGRFLSYEKTLECDEIYYDNFSFKQDFVIFFKSLGTIIKNILR